MHTYAQHIKENPNARVGVNNQKKHMYKDTRSHKREAHKKRARAEHKTYAVRT